MMNITYASLFPDVDEAALRAKVAPLVQAQTGSGVAPIRSTRLDQAEVILDLRKGIGKRTTTLAARV